MLWLTYLPVVAGAGSMLLRILSSGSLIIRMFQRYADVVLPPTTTTTTTTQPHWPMLRVLLQPSFLGILMIAHSVHMLSIYILSTHLSTTHFIKNTF